MCEGDPLTIAAREVLRTSKRATRQRRHAGWLARQPWFNDSQRTAYRTSKLQVCAHKHGIGESSVMEWLDVAGWCPLAEAHLLDAVPDGLELIGKVLATGVGTAQAKERKRSVGVPAFGSSIWFKWAERTRRSPTRSSSRGRDEQHDRDGACKAEGVV